MTKLPKCDGNSLAFRDVRISYPSLPRPVLSGFTLDVPHGTFLAVVGPSGCGKTSLLHAAAGFIPVAAGTVYLGAMKVVEPSVRLGFVSQRYSLFPWLTVERNIAFGLHSLKCSDSVVNAAVDKLLAVIGLEVNRHNYPDQLSGGMQQRVALARAIAPNPDVLLLDEPFSALDSDTRRRMRALLLQLWTDYGTTIMFVTHDIEEAVLLADRVLAFSADARSLATFEIPFPRPRAAALIYDGCFRECVEEISKHVARISDILNSE